MDKKFLLNEKQANLWKFICIYKRYINKKLNSNEYLNFVQNLKLLNKENAELNELIMDQKFLDQFIFKWEYQFINFNINNKR